MKIKDFQNDRGWGKLIAVHEIGEYKIVEYDRWNDDGETTGEINFHPYIDDKDLCVSTESLDKAIVIAIAMKHENNPNSQAAKYFSKMIGME